MPESCPDENTLVAFIQGDLDDDERKALEDHIDVCPDCTFLVMELGALFDSSPQNTPTPAPSQTKEDPPRRSEAFELTGRFLERYEPGELLGSGGMGTVFEAWDVQLERKVALKLLRSDLVDSPLQPQLEARVLREARSLAKLSHPNILTVFEVGVHQGLVYLVTQYIEGISLDVYLSKHEPEWQEILKLYTNIASGLAHAHELGVVHRDIKPSNIMVTPTGQAILIDFGLAASTTPTDEVSLALTHTGVTLGTPAYMSPEQHMGHKAGPQSDVFSLCASLFHSLCGERPFAGDSSQEVAMRAYAGERTEITRTDLPQTLVDVLDCGLDAQPEERFADAGVLLSQLEPILKASLEKTTPAKKTPLWPIPLMILLIAAGVIVLAVNQPPKEDPDKKTTTTKPNVQEVTPKPREDRPKETVKAPTAPPNDAWIVASQKMSTSIDKALLALGEHQRNKKDSAEKKTSAGSPTRPRKTPSAVAKDTKKDEPPKKTGTSSVKPEDVIKVGQRAIAYAEVHRGQDCIRIAETLPGETDGYPSFVRSKCLMSLGKCSQGKKLMQKYLERSQTPNAAKFATDTEAQRLCPPPKTQRGKYLMWQLQPLTAVSGGHGRGASSCKAQARRGLKIINRSGALMGVTASEKSQIALFFWGVRDCLGKKKTPDCSLLHKLSLQIARLQLSSSSAQVQENTADKQMKSRYPGCPTP